MKKNFMRLEDVDIIINGESFSQREGYHQIAFDLRKDGSLKRSRIFNRITGGARYKRTTHQVAGNVIVRSEWSKFQSKLLVLHGGNTYDLNDRNVENEIVLKVKELLVEDKSLYAFLMPVVGESKEHFLAVEEETLIEERKRLKKEKFEKYYGISVPDSYKVSPNAGLNYVVKDLDFDPKSLSIEDSGRLEFWGIRRANKEVVEKQLLVLSADGKLPDWRKFHYLVVLETEAYEGPRQRYGVRVDVYRTNPKDNQSSMEEKEAV